MARIFSLFVVLILNTAFQCGEKYYMPSLTMLCERLQSSTIIIQPPAFNTLEDACNASKYVVELRNLFGVAEYNLDLNTTVIISSEGNCSVVGILCDRNTDIEGSEIIYSAMFNTYNGTYIPMQNQKPYVLRDFEFTIQ